ncbi:MAG: hypothetical protein IPI46_13295 [Bacteroidetes bacterium]|nr:hypothetical protein [Bacteroidota bacterium]
MKKFSLLFFLLLLIGISAFSQCAMCTKTAASLDDESARGLNSGIIFLAFMPITMIGFIGYQWWKRNREVNV